MRHLAILRFVTILLLAIVPLASQTLVGPASVAVADDDDDWDDHDDDDDHDADRDDDHDDDRDDDRDDKRGDHRDTWDQEPPVVAVPTGYVVDVVCEPIASGSTTCTFTVTPPDSGKKVGFLQVPAENLCADVIATDAKHADPQPHTHVIGYTSSGGDKETVTIELDGHVTASGTATYWIKAASAVFPVDGPGLVCAPVADTAATVTFDASPTATPAPSTGTIAIAVLSCAAVPADTSEFDWFGECQPGAEPQREFELAPNDDSAPPVTATTDTAGEATFADLAPGEYRLNLVDDSWCRAVSDNVNADSEVVVEAGATSTVWIFVCDDKAGV